jgi:methyltransferase
MGRALLTLALAFVPMALETRRSQRHERALRHAGAVEPPGDVYAAMQVAYPASFAAIALEGWMRQSEPGPSLAAGLVTFTAAKVLKYWAIATLGPRWTFRVLVPPGAPLVTHGPYRLMRHPNYLAVVGEIAGVALTVWAPITGAAALAGFGWLLWRRIAVEDRTLGRG